MGFFSSINNIKSSYSSAPNLNNRLDGTVNHTNITLTSPADTVTLSKNKQVQAEAAELKKSYPDLYKKLKKQVIRGKKNMDKNKTATAIMRALEENPETKNIAMQIKAKYEPPVVKTPSAKEIARQQQLQHEREISKKAREQHIQRTIEKFESPSKPAPEMIEGDPIQAKKLQHEVEDAFSTKNIKKQFDKVSARIQRLSQEAPKREQSIARLKEGIQKARETLAQLQGKIGADEAVQKCQQIIATNEARITRINNYVDSTKRLYSSLSEMLKPAVPSSTETAANTGKGLWHWLSKTTKGKWTAAGVGLTAIGSAVYAFLSGDKTAENVKSFDKAA